MNVPVISRSTGPVPAHLQLMASLMNLNNTNKTSELMRTPSQQSGVIFCRVWFTEGILGAVQFLLTGHNTLGNDPHGLSPQAPGSSTSRPRLSVLLIHYHHHHHWVA